KLTGVRAYARDDYYVTVGAGTRLSELEETLAADNMWLPLVSPWPEATVGGIVAANFNAPLRMRYGSARDLLLVAKTVLPDGRVIRAGRPVVKNVAGYDLPKLLAGSRGTLGLITEITLKIAPRPRAQVGLVVPVDNLAHGLSWGSALLKICLVASGLVLTPAGNLPGVSAPLALVYTAEGLPEDVAAEMEEVRAALSHLGAPAPLPAQISATQLWADILAATAPAETLLHAGVAPGKLPDFVTGLAANAIAAPFVADLANGMVYLRGAETAPVQRAARALGGYATVLRAPAPPADVWGHAPDGLDLMRAIKQHWDPHNILAPGGFIL
ncbi:MAG: FAD-binding oxidoreductase, partial [Chloroflexi bacterium]